jgi:hypothetical protein
MEVYHCKLEEVENRRMISVDVGVKETNQLEKSFLFKGWALSIRKPEKEFLPELRNYLETKYSEGVSGVKHWKSKDVVADRKIGE